MVKNWILLRSSEKNDQLERIREENDLISCCDKIHIALCIRRSRSVLNSTLFKLINCTDFCYYSHHLLSLAPTPHCTTARRRHIPRTSSAWKSRKWFFSIQSVRFIFPFTFFCSCAASSTKTWEAKKKKTTNFSSMSSERTIIYVWKKHFQFFS